MSIFEEYSPSDKDAEWTLAGDFKEWTWFEIYVFTKEDVGPVEELNKLNSLLVSHNIHEYGEFLVCLDHSLLPDTAFAFYRKRKKRNKKWLQLLIIFSISGELLMKMGVWPGQFLIIIYQNCIILTMKILICKKG